MNTLYHSILLLSELVIFKNKVLMDTYLVSLFIAQELLLLLLPMKKEPTLQIQESSYSIVLLHQCDGCSTAIISKPRSIL